ncbi:MAG TPA: glycosyltransferase family 4 protein [Chloroflexia bacterium]|nr:glycosyltransferase family 4 protein [Chloroflexia bacterium]
MNIAIVSDVFPPKSGGSGWSSFYLARALQQKGHSVNIVVPKEGPKFGQAEREYEGLVVTEFIYEAARLPFIRNYTRNEQLYPRFAEFLTTFFKEHQIDLAHGQHYLTIPPTVMAAEKLAIPSVATVRDYWPVCYWTTHLTGEKVCPGCSELNRLRCLYNNQGLSGIIAAPASIYMGANLRLKQQWLARADRILAVSSYVAGKLRPFVPEERLLVVPNFIDVARLELLTTEPPRTPEASQPYLLFTGKLEENKGTRILLEVLRQVRPALPTLIAGEGKLQEEVKEAIARDNLNVKLLGWVENEEVLRLMRHSEALLFPSLWPEPLSRVTLEAQGAGALVVGMNTGGTPDVVQDGYNGLLAPDAATMAARLQEILQPEKAAERARMKENARQVAREKFSQEVVLDRVEEIYRQLLGSKNFLKKASL